MEQNLKESAKICVVVRKRPMSGKETQKGDTDIVEKRDDQTIVVVEPKYFSIMRKL